MGSVLTLAGAILAAGAVAAIVLTVFIAAGRKGRGEKVVREDIEAELLCEIARLGGESAEGAIAILRSLRQAKPGSRGRIDIASWSSQYAGLVTPEERFTLLEDAVRVAMTTNRKFPLEQYNGLVEMSFALGFHADALARLRQTYGFEYVDWAERGRPREADRTGGGAVLFETRSVDEAVNLEILGLASGATRQQITAAYRRLALESHPDRFHDATFEDQAVAADRFRSITRAYEELLGSNAGD